MYTDSPLKTKAEDKLGRYQFAEEIASGLVNSFENDHESIVLGINGSWGSGKSTLVNFIIQEITRLSSTKNTDIIVIKFNPWMFSGQRELQNIFLKELYQKFQLKKEKLKEASQKLADLLEHLTWLKYVHSGTGEVINDAQSFLSGLNKEKDLGQIKSDIDDLLVKNQIKLYITIDDIDRLTPSERADIFQLVKLTGNFANTVFLLAYDRDVVTGALESQFGKNGTKYIEKIVQVDYTIPRISKREIKRLFSDSIEQSFSNSDLGQMINNSFEDLQGEDFVKLFNSLRDIYRFNNSLKLRLPSIYKEINIRDFFIIESIRIFKPEAYTFLLESKEKLVSEDLSEVQIQINDKENEISSTQHIEEQKFDAITTKLVKSLFVFDQTFFNSRSLHTALIQRKRIANPNYYDRYFNLKLDNIDIHEEIIKEFVLNADDKNLVKLLKDINDEKKLPKFLLLSKIKSAEASEEQIENMIIAAFTLSDKIKYDRKSIHSNNSIFLDIQDFCSEQLTLFPNIEKRREVLKRHITEIEKPISFSSIYTLSCVVDTKDLNSKEYLFKSIWTSRIDEKNENTGSYSNTIDQYFKEALIKLFAYQETNPQFLNIQEFNFYLYDLLNYEPELYTKEIEKLISNSEKLVSLISFYVNQSKRYFSAQKDVYQNIKKQLPKEINGALVYKIFKSLDHNNLDKDEIQTIKLFLKYHEDELNQ